ncbi:MAG: response regulator [Burkholderiaceae bacterium]|jgi:two-component system phosphate regulon response regulator PhoB|nr:response regulator [Burkholderiaceae bacterium]
MSPGKTHVLVVEDEPAIMALVVCAIEMAGWQALQAETAQQAWRILEKNPPDGVVLDWMLPDESGLHLLGRIRSDPDKKVLPVVMLTARGQEEDKVSGLDKGADDYITKPFSPRELIARLNAVLRRRAPERAKGQVRFAGIVLDVERHVVELDGHILEMSKTEFGLLRFFLSNPDRVFSRAQLLDKIWRDQLEMEERTVDVYVLRLRKALKHQGGLLKTVRGVGYMLSDKADPS